MVLSFFLDLLFPPNCVTCGSIGGFICQKCFNQMNFYDKPIDLQIQNSALDELHACTTYQKSGGDFIQTFKYRGTFAVAPTLGYMMHHTLPLLSELQTLIPVPLHRKRENERGFNQAEFLARELGKKRNLKVLNALQKVVATTPQAELDREKRLTHLTNCFSLKSNTSIEDKIVGIVDDVSTTGATLNECAKILKKHGAKKVIGIVFAHG
jgi:competence protein ComFC